MKQMSMFSISAEQTRTAETFSISAWNNHLLHTCTPLSHAMQYSLCDTHLLDTSAWHPLYGIICSFACATGAWVTAIFGQPRATKGSLLSTVCLAPSAIQSAHSV